MKMKFTIIAFFLFPVLMQAQFQIDKPALPIDSLRKVLPFLRDSARVDCLNELTRSCTEVQQYDSAFSLARQAYGEASAINYVKGLGDACLRYGILSQWRLWNSKEAERYFLEAISWYKKIENSEGLGHAMLGLGAALNNQGSLDEAKKNFEQSAFHFRKTGNEVMLAELTDQFGYLYNAKGDFEKFFESIKKGLREKKRLGDNRGMIWSFYSLAHIYQLVGDFETALDYFRQTYQQAQSQSIPWHPSRSMGNIFLNLENYDSSIYHFRKGLLVLPDDGPSLAGLGKLYMLRREYNKAMHHLQNALINFKKRNDDEGQMWALVDMGKSHTGLKQYSKALEYAAQCFTIAMRRKSKQAIQYVYEINWKVYEALHQKDSAYFYFQKFVTLRDSLNEARLKLQHLQKLALYKVEAKEEEQQARIDLLHKDNQLKQQQLQEEALMKKIFAGSLAALILLGIIIFRNIALKRRNEKHRRELAENELQIQKLESEKTKAELGQQATELEMQALRAQMNPHFIFNCLSSINRFILKNETEAASDYLTKFSRLIRTVLTNSKKTFISLEDELDTLRLYLDMERLRFKNSFEYNISFKNEIDPENIFIPPLLLQPFAENAIWHGLMHKGGSGHLQIALSTEDKIVTCIITDNGIGRSKAAMIKSKSAEKQKSMGLQITTQRLSLLNHDVDAKTFYEIEDITDAASNVAGTRVTLKIHYRNMVDAFA